MNFNKVVFVKSVTLWMEEVLFEEKKEIIFVGRSNVWKSSIMNALFDTKDLVKTSSTPGKTRNANLFLVDNKYYFTDLPGYGFAKMGKEKQKGIDGLISWYIEEKKWYIQKVLILIDSKIWPQASDIDMYEYLVKLELPVLVVLSKVDRLSKSELLKSMVYAEKIFFWQDIIAISSKKSTNITQLQKYLKTILHSK